MSSGGPGQCLCGAHRLHRVFRYFWDHPSASRKDCAKALGMSLTNVWQSFHEIKKRNLDRLCPECFKPAVYEGICHECGAERDNPFLPPELDKGIFEQQSAPNHLHADNLLGSQTKMIYRPIVRVLYQREGMAPGLVSKHAAALRHRTERVEDLLLANVKSDIMNEMKRCYPDEVVTDTAGRLCHKEVAEFRAKYPMLATSRNVRRQLAANVMSRLMALYPRLRTLSGPSLTPLPEVQR